MMNRAIGAVAVLTVCLVCPSGCELEKRVELLEQKVQAVESRCARLDARIAGEESKRSASSEALEEKIKDEQEARRNEVGRLAGRIAAEERSRTGEVNRLAGRIGAEEQSRMGEVNRLDTAIKNVDRNARTDFNTLSATHRTDMGLLEEAVRDNEGSLGQARTDLERLRADIQDIRKVLADSCRDYDCVLYLAARNIVDDFEKCRDGYLREYVARPGEPLDIEIIILDASRIDGKYCDLGHDLSHQVAAILGAQRFTRWPIRTQDEVERRMHQMVAAPAPDIHDRDQLAKIGVTPDRLFYLVGAIRKSGGAYTVHYSLQSFQTLEVFPLSAVGETIPRIEEVVNKYEHLHETPAQKLAEPRNGG